MSGAGRVSPPRPDGLSSIGVKPRPAALLALVPALLVLVGLLAVTPAQALAGSGSGVTSRGASYAAPEVGSCWSYGYKAALKPVNRGAAVPCTGPHTAQTVAVIKLRSVGSDRAVDAGYRRCLKVVERTVGPALSRTAYSQRFFLPGKKEVRKGARWLRCDVVLSAGRTLAPLPTPLVTQPLTDEVALCAVTAGGKTIATTCASKHDYRFTAGYQAKGKKYPGRDKLLRSVILTCADKVENPKKFWAFYPDATEWSAGYRAVSCLSRTRA